LGRWVNHASRMVDLSTGSGWACRVARGAVNASPLAAGSPTNRAHFAPDCRAGVCRDSSDTSVTRPCPGRQSSAIRLADGVARFGSRYDNTPCRISASNLSMVARASSSTGRNGSVIRERWVTAATRASSKRLMHIKDGSLGSIIVREPERGINHVFQYPCSDRV